MSKDNLNLGSWGEEAAVGLLKKNSYRILARNYKSVLGEIDIIAADKDTICFIEVKTRNSDRFGLPQEAISKQKQLHLSRQALLFLKKNNLLERKARFDVISVMPSKGEPEMTLIKNAFELATELSY